MLENSLNLIVLVIAVQRRTNTHIQKKNWGINMENVVTLKIEHGIYQKSQA